MYVPILKAKQGEFRALPLLVPDIRSQIVPLLEAPPLEGYGDAVTEEPPTVDTQLERLPAKLEQALGPDRRFFLDLGLVESDPALAGGEQPISYIFGKLHDRGLAATPVTALGRDDDYREAATEVARADDTGLCMRIVADDLDDPEAAVALVLEEIAEDSLEPEDVDLLFDLGEVGANVGPSVFVMDVTLRDLAERDRWRSLTVAATSFPDVSAYGPDSINVAQRYEWDLWRRIRGRELPRPPQFGDYGIFGAQLRGAGGEFSFAPSPNLRYTTDDDWLIFKAKSPVRHGYEQFNSICQALVARPEFAGADFSWGDDFIAKCAAGTAGPGNASTWIQVNTNHHITAVVGQLATHGGP
jgi:Beta protein